MNDLVKPEYQYGWLEDPPLDPVRMAWPFKTEEELKILSKWFKEEDEKYKEMEKGRRKKILEEAGKAFL